LRWASPSFSLFGARPWSLWLEESKIQRTEPKRGVLLSVPLLSLSLFSLLSSLSLSLEDQRVWSVADIGLEVLDNQMAHGAVASGLTRTQKAPQCVRLLWSDPIEIGTTSFFFFWSQAAISVGGTIENPVNRKRKAPNRCAPPSSLSLSLSFSPFLLWRFTPTTLEERREK